jgi:hypothetical protein
VNFPRIIEAGRNQIALEELAQVQRAILEAQLHGAPIDGFLELRRAGEGERNVGTTSGFFNGHLKQVITQ